MILSQRSKNRPNDQNENWNQNANWYRISLRVDAAASVLPGRLGPTFAFSRCPPVSHAPAPAPDEESVATFKVNVNLVDVVFTVKDKQGALVPHRLSEIA